MNKVKLFSVLFLLLSSPLALAQSTGHAGHGGAGGGAGGAMACQKLRINKQAPAPLAEAAPGSEFSFLAFGVEDPNHMEVTVKKIPVTVSTELKDTFYIVTGHLPAQLKGTPARVTVKVTSKIPKCNAEDGWLIKISQ